VVELRRRTFQENYGADNVFCTPEFQVRRKKFFQEHYGVDHQLQVPEIQAQIRETMMERHGVENPGQSSEVRRKMRATCQERYGVDFVFQIPGFEELSRKTHLERRGVVHHSKTDAFRQAARRRMQDPLFRAKLEKAMVEKYGSASPFAVPALRKKCEAPEAQAKRHATMKRNGTYGKSKIEEDLFAILLPEFPKTRRQERVGAWAIDFYIPEVDVYLNLNGTYWHGKGRSEEDLLQSSFKRDQVILATKRRDSDRRAWFAKSPSIFLEVWGDDFREDPFEVLRHLRSLR